MITLGNKQLCEYCLTENCGEPCRFCGFNKASFKKEVGALPPGSILSGKYIVGRLMGKGGFGITYLAYDISRDKKIAIKEYYPGVLAARDEDGYTVAVSGSEDTAVYKNGLEKFYEEASLVSTFNGNPNIVSVYEFFHENETAYFAMELLSGCTLKAYVEEHGALSPEQTLFIADKVSSALMVVHSANTLHRDVSPDNIMLCSDGKVKLIDFGAARQVAVDNPKSMSVILKQGFAPLEQYQKRGKQGPWTDLYTLGATLYYALTAECIDDPMTRLDDDSEFQANSHGIEPQLWELIRHALNLKTEDRYQDAFEFRAALNGIGYKPEPINIGSDGPEQVPVMTAAAAPSAPSRTEQDIPPVEYERSAIAQPASVQQVSTFPSTEALQPATAQPAPAQPLQQAQAAQPTPTAGKSKKKLIAISSIALASLAIIGVAVYLLFFRGKGRTDKGGSGGNYGGNVINNSGTSQTEQFGRPVMTVNGENIPLAISGYFYTDRETGSDITGVIFAGQKGGKVYDVTIAFLTADYPEYPTANTAYSLNSFGDGMTVSFVYVDLKNNDNLSINHYEEGFYSSDVIIGNYTPNGALDISVSGKFEEDGMNFDFSASGTLELRDYDELIKDMATLEDEAYKAAHDTPPIDETPQTVTIRGQSYSTSVEYLDLSNMGLTNKDIAELKYFTNLKRVNLDGNALTDISVLVNIPTLEEIDATDNDIYDISFLRDLKNIRIVVMNNNKIEDISVFSEFTTIEKIWLNDNNIFDISPIAGNKGLVEVGFNDCPIGDISALNGMNKLEMLALANCGITDIRVLKTCTALKKLYLGYNNIADFSPIDGLDLDEFYY